MMARTYSAGMLGIDGFLVTVDSEIGSGSDDLRVNGPWYSLSGSALRVRDALDTCGVVLPRCQQLVKLGPSYRRADKTGLDLAIACALMISHGVIPEDSLSGLVLWGELTRDGSVRPCDTTFLVATTARREGFRGVVLPAASVQEAAPVRGLDLLPVSNLRQLIAHLRREVLIPWAPVCVPERDESIDDEPVPDLADVRDPFVRLALEVMLAGGHHMLLYGPHRSGKTTISRQILGLLGELDDDGDVLDLTKIHAVRSPTSVVRGLMRVPQIRSIDPGMPEDELFGCGYPSRPGEVSLAHRGVLVLDDLPEFSQSCIQRLTRAMLDGFVIASDGARMPTRFQLLATMRRCKCKWHGQPDRACKDRPADNRKLERRIPKRLLDQFDLVVALAAGPRAELALPSPGGDLCQRIAAARTRQHERLVSMREGWRTNAEIPNSYGVNEKFCRLTPAAEDLLTTMGRQRGLDLPALRSIRRVARTVADLEIERDPAAPIDVDAIMLADQLRALPVRSVRAAVSLRNR